MAEGFWTRPKERNGRVAGGCVATGRSVAPHGLFLTKIKTAREINNKNGGGKIEVKKRHKKTRPEEQSSEKKLKKRRDCRT